MTHRHHTGDTVRVLSRSIDSGKPFDAVVVNQHVSGYYVDPLGRHVPTPIFVTEDEVSEINHPETPTFVPGAVAKLGSPDGPDVTVIAVFSRGLLVSVDVGADQPRHVMVAPASDLCVQVNAARDAGVFV